MKKKKLITEEEVDAIYAKIKCLAEKVDKLESESFKRKLNREYYKEISKEGLVIFGGFFVFFWVVWVTTSCF